jgi:methyltransferase family protein
MASRLEPVPYRPVSFLSSQVFLTRVMAFNALRCLLRRRRRTREVVSDSYDRGLYQRLGAERPWEASPDLAEFLSRSSIGLHATPPALRSRVMAWLSGTLVGDDREMIAVLDGRLVRLEHQAFTRIAFERVRAVLEEYSDPDDTVVELGSGWGRNLFALSRALHRAGFEGYEISANGVAVAREIARHFRLDNVTFGHVDLLDGESEGYGRVGGRVVLTYHALEQLPRHAATVIDLLLARAPKRVIHVEPSRDAVPNRPAYGWNVRLYLRAVDYQEALWSTLVRLEEQGRVRILRKQVLHTYNHVNQNPCLIVWEPRRA